MNIEIRRFILIILLQFFVVAVFAQPTLNVAFSPATIGPGSNTQIVYTIINASNATVTDINFSNILPTVPGPMNISNSANVNSNCDLGVTGSIFAPDDGSTITVSQARLGANQSCIIEVNVTASTPGVHPNPAVTLTSSAGSSMSLPVDLTVVDTLPGFSKNFTPSTVTFGSTSTLTFTIDNMLNANRIGNLDFTDTLPSGITIASPANAFTDCISAGAPDTSIIATPGTNQISIDANGINSFPGFEVLAAGAICTVTVDVINNSTGSLINQSSLILADFVPAGFAVDTLNVSPSQLILTKEFTDDPVPPGDNATLLFTVFNANRDFSANNIAFTDDLSATLAGLTFNSISSNDCSGSSVTGVGGTTISFSGGTLPPEASCTVEVSLSVPAAAAVGSYTNVTSNITGVIDGDFITDNPATADLFVEPSPILTKEFLTVGTLTPDPVVKPGDDVVVRFTITNTSTTSMATDITFDDELTDGGPGTGFLPFPIIGGLPPVPNPPCGAGSMLAFYFPGTDRQGLRLTTGTLAAAPAAGSTCTFDVTLTIPSDFPAGTYANTTGNIMATVDGATRLGDSASDTLTVIAAPTLTKAFTDDPVAPGGTVTLEFTLEHSFNAPTDATNITFTDDLNTVLAGLTANVPPTPNPPCGPGSSLTSSAGDTLLTFAGGTLSPGDSCTFSVTLDIPAAAPAGAFSNTTSAVNATVSGQMATSLASSDDLNIAGLIFTKEFLSNPVVAGSNTTLRFTIDNVHPTENATITSFTDNLGSNLTGLAALGPATFDTCGGSLSGTNFLVYVGGSVFSGTSCVIEVDVLVPSSTADGNYSNLTSILLANQIGSVNIDPAQDTLVVDSNLLQLTKSFTNDPAAAGGPVSLEFVLTNLDMVNAASDIDFTDNLAAGLAGLSFDSLASNDCAATVTGVGTTLITVDNASLTAGGSCTIVVNLTVPGGTASGVYTNTTSTVTGMINGLPVNGEAATDQLDVVELLVFSKSFDGSTTATGTAILTFTITNPGTSLATGISFSDDLDAVISGLIATNLPATPCGISSSISGTSLLTFSGGELAPLGGTCSFDVEVTVPITATAGTFPNTTSDLFASGLTVADPATADLTIEPAPSFAKSFTPDAIGQELTSTLTFSIDNTSSTIAATNLNFTDNLPAGIIIATPSITNNTCGGTLTATAGTGVISLTGASVGSGAACIIQMDVQGNNTGDLVNLTGDLTSSSGNSGTATDTLTVNPQPLFSKVFNPDLIIVGGVTTLTFTIDNSLSTVTTTALDFIDNLPTNLVIATPANAANTCGGTLTATDGANVIDFTDGSVAAAASCTLSVDITANTSDTFMNITSDLTSSLGNSGTATDNLLVNPAPLFSKAFAPDVIATGGTSTLTFTIDNTGSTVDANGFSFTDNLPMGVTIVSGNVNLNAGCAGLTFTSNPGDASFTINSGIAFAGQSCVFSVDVTSTQNGMLLNQTGDLTSSLGNSGIAIDTLTVTPLPTFSKVFMTNPTIINTPITLTFAINNALGLSDVSGLVFTDNLPTGMQLAATPNASTNCTGGIFTAIPNSFLFSYSGGTVSMNDVCTVSVDVIATTSGALDNTSSVLITDLGDSNMASATLNVDLPPVFSKTFTPDAIAPNGISQLIFTIDNSLSTITATALDFVDNLPTNLVIATPANASTTCSGGTMSAPDGSNSIAYTNGSIAGLSSCTVSVDVTSSVLGSLVNTSGDLTSSHGNSGPAMASLLITNAPTISKAFTTNPQLINNVNTLTFTIDNSMNTIDVTGLTFNDPLPAGMLVNTPANASTTCTGGVLNAVDGSNMIDYSGGTVTATSSCTITVDIVTSVFGTLTNTTSVLSTSLGNSNSAIADLTIDPAPIFSKGFMPNAITPNGISILQLTIDNSGSTLDVNNLDFTDVLPNGLVIATPSNTSNTCIGGILSAVQGTDTISYSGGSTPAGSNCTISLEVTAALANTYTNLTGDLTSSHGNSGTATADLLVTNAPTLAKVFTINPHVINQANPLVFTIDNSMNGIDVSNLTFNDPLPAGLQVANPANASTTCNGGTLTAVTGSSNISYSGGAVNASSTCTITVDTVATVTGQFTNTTSILSTSLGASNQAIADLTISSAPIFSKAFMPDMIVEGGVSQLVFTINNSANNLAITDLSFTDNLPTGLSITTSPFPTINCNIGELNGVFSGLPGSSVIDFSLGRMDALSVCTITVDITAMTSGVYENITEDLTSNLGNSGNATATLTVQPGISASKSFTSNTVFAGQTIVLDFTINNNSDISASDITFSDDLNSFVSGSIATDLPQNDVCGAGSTLTGSSLLTLSDGSLAPNSSCQFSVTVMIPENTIQGDYINVTSPVDADFNGTTVNGSASSAASTNLIINGALRIIPMINSWLTLGILSLILLIFAYRSFMTNRQQ